MHEVSLSADIINIVETSCFEHQISKVSKVNVAIGTLSCVELTALQTAFDILKLNTLCESAQLIIQHIEATAKCQQCQQTFKITYTTKQCPTCHSIDCDILTGYELNVTSYSGDESP